MLKIKSNRKPLYKRAKNLIVTCTRKNINFFETSLKNYIYIYIATGLFLDLKWQFSGGGIEEGRVPTPTSFSIFDSYDMKSL